MEGVPPPPLLGEEAAAAAAAAAARFVGADFGEPIRTEGVLLLLPRVRTGDSGGDDGRTDAADLPDGGDGAARFAGRAGEPRPPPPPAVPGLAAVPRLTGVDLGDTGGFLVDGAVAATAAAAAAVRLLGTGIRELFFALEEGCLPVSGCCLMAAAAAAAVEARRVEGRVRRDCAARRGVGELGGAPLPSMLSEEEEVFSPSSSRARLMFSNCRLISAVLGGHFQRG